MEQTKENLINSLIVSLADSTDLSISELKEKLQMELYDWNVTKVTGKCAKAHSFRSGLFAQFSVKKWENLNWLSHNYFTQLLLLLEFLQRFPPL